MGNGDGQRGSGDISGAGDTSGPDGPERAEEWRRLSRETWDERAPWWDEVTAARATGDDFADEVRATAEALALRPGGRVLDAGCGTGPFAIAFAGVGYRVDAVDLSAEMIDRAGAHAARVGIEVAWRVADLADLPYPNGTFDAVQARLSLHFAFDMPATLAELSRVLRPTGRLYASVPGPLSPISANVWQRHLETVRRANNYVTPWELEALLGHLGWEVIAHRPDLGATPDGSPPRFDPGATRRLGLPRALCQAASTTWAMVATHPDRPLGSPPAP